MSSARVKESSLFTMYLLSLPLTLPLPVGHIVLVNVSILEPSGILRVGEEPFVVLRKLISSFVDVKHCSEKDPYFTDQVQVQYRYSDFGLGKDRKKSPGKNFNKSA